MTVFLGNQRVREKITSDALAQKLPHALLISGPKGIGKFSFLQSIATKILEQSSAHNGRIFSGKFFPPEVMMVDELYQEGKNSNLESLSKTSFFSQSHRKKLKKKSNTIGVDDLEAFTKHLFETTNSEYKIVLIRDTERMTRETSNKFLKILEEPPEKTLFLMTCSSEKKLLDTFVSRVRREYFSLTSEEMIKNFLENNGAHFSSEKRKRLQDIAAGRGEFLQKMTEDDAFYEAEKKQQEESEQIFSMTKLQKMKEAEDTAKKDLEIIQEKISFLEKFLRKNLRKEISTHSHIPLNRISSSLTAIEQAKTQLVQNGNKRMILEHLFLEL